MSERRRFGSIAKRTAKNGRKYVQARYQPPIWAYSKWPDLPRHHTKNFDAEYTAMAEAWLAEQERLIKLGSWEPPRIEKTKELSSTMTFREYALDFVRRRIRRARPSSGEDRRDGTHNASQGHGRQRTRGGDAPAVARDERRDPVADVDGTSMTYMA